MAQVPQTRQPDEMYCSNCRAVMKRDDQFCPQCGARAGVAPGAVSPPGGQYVSQQAPQAVQQDVVGAGRYILNFILAGLIGLALTYFLRNQGWLATWISLVIFVLVVLLFVASA